MTTHTIPASEMLRLIRYLNEAVENLSSVPTTAANSELLGKAEGGIKSVRSALLHHAIADVTVEQIKENV